MTIPARDFTGATFKRNLKTDAQTQPTTERRHFDHMGTKGDGGEFAPM